MSAEAVGKHLPAVVTLDRVARMPSAWPPQTPPVEHVDGAADRVSPPTPAGDLVWYAAYGSNMLAARLGCYLAGGRPAGGLRTYPGCRDCRPPIETVPVMLPGGIYFALESITWTGGMAFYDRLLPGRTVARAYLVSAQQFADIVAQEMHRPPGADLDLIEETVARGRAVVGPGRYETLVYCGSRSGYPVLTFTAPWRAGEVAWNAPAPAYLGMLAGGLHEAHGWDADRIAAYLGARPGVEGNWSPIELAAVVHRAIGS
jgi:hypothetical protein